MPFVWLGLARSTDSEFCNVTNYACFAPCGNSGCKTVSGTIYCGQLRREKPWEGTSGALSYQVLLHLCPEDMASFSPLPHLFIILFLVRKPIICFSFFSHSLPPLPSSLLFGFVVSPSSQLCYVLELNHISRKCASGDPISFCADEMGKETVVRWLKPRARFSHLSLLSVSWEACLKKVAIACAPAGFGIQSHKSAFWNDVTEKEIRLGTPPRHLFWFSFLVMKLPVCQWSWEAGSRLGSETSFLL